MNNLFPKRNIYKFIIKEKYFMLFIACFGVSGKRKKKLAII